MKNKIMIKLFVLINLVMPIIAINANSNKEYQYNIAPNIKYALKDNLERQISVKYGAPFVCHYCGKPFCSQSTLDNHIRRKHKKDFFAKLFLVDDDK